MGNNTVNENDYNNMIKCNSYPHSWSVNQSGVYNAVFSLNGENTTQNSLDFDMNASDNDSDNTTSGKTSEGIDQTLLPNNVYFMLDGYTSALIVTDAEKNKGEGENKVKTLVMMEKTTLIL